MAGLIEELKRRKVFRVAAMYAVVAWLLIQVADVVLPTFGAPDWVNQTLIFFLVLGFPIALILAWAYESTPEGIKPDHVAPSTAVSPITSSLPINYAILAIVLIIAGVQVADRWFGRGERAGGGATASANTSVTNLNAVFKSQLDLDIELTNDPMRYRGMAMFFDFMPDGESLFYVDSRPDSVTGREAVRLRRRFLNDLDSELLFDRDSVSIDFPRVSPDGSSVAYLTNFPIRQLAVASLNGGSIVQIDRAVEPNSVQWLDDDTLIYVNDDGLIVHTLMEKSSRLLWPSTVDRPEPRSFVRLTNPDLVLATLPRSRVQPESTVGLLNLASGEWTELVQNAFAPNYAASGHLLFMRDSNLWAVGFDPETLKVSGEQSLVVEGIESSEFISGAALYAVSSSGHLVYMPGSDVYGRGEKRLVWIDSNGSQTPLDLPSAHYEDVMLSSDAQRLALTIFSDGAPDIWTHDLNAPGILNRVTRIGTATDPLWTPDGSNLIFRQLETGELQTLGIIDADGVGLVKEYARLDTSAAAPRAFDLDGNLLMTEDSRLQNQGQDISRFEPTNLDRPQQPVLASEFTEYGPAISPDGMWMAYTSDETGEDEIYIRPYPNVESGKWRISIDGGMEPKWGRDSSALHFSAGGRSKITTVTLAYQPNPRVMERQELELGQLASSGVPFYAVGEDGRFLIMRPAVDLDAESLASEASRLPILVTNFTAELAEKVPAGL